MATIEEPRTVEIWASKPSAGELLEIAGREALRDALRSGKFDHLAWYCLSPQMPEAFLLEMCDRGLCLGELGHRRGPRKLLERMAEAHRYPEAIVSLAIELYTRANESVEAFDTFVRRHADNVWMLESLATLDASSEDKDRVYLAIVAGHPDHDRIARIQVVRGLAMEAEKTTDAAAIDRLFASGEPQVWLALADNPAVPREVLAKLAAARGVKRAAEIRDRSRRRLAAR